MSIRHLFSQQTRLVMILFTMVQLILLACGGNPCQVNRKVIDRNTVTTPSATVRPTLATGIQSTYIGANSLMWYYWNLDNGVDREILISSSDCATSDVRIALNLKRVQ